MCLLLNTGSGTLQRATLFIFTKPPHTGISKTRLAADIGRAQARRLNRMSQSRVMRAAIDPRWHTVLRVAPDHAARYPDPLWSRADRIEPQGPGDLGDRLTRAFASAPTGPVIFIGTDAPDICRADIWRAASLLRRKKGVFGPADDGGFWLLALHKHCGDPAPFEGVRWSTRNAMADVAANLRTERLAYLHTLVDLDDGESLKVWKRAPRRRFCS